MTLDKRGGSFEINDNQSLWSGKNLHDLYKQAYTLGMACTNHRARSGTWIDLFQFTLDETAVDFLEGLNVPAYKIASFETTIYLNRQSRSHRKPLIISTEQLALES